LSEVKLSACQTLTDCEGGKLIEAVLVLNAELESWLLSLGSHVKVLAPKVLVDLINVDIENMYNLYRRA
jgi:predicted DNA-binding transcriptional regulator YafY